MKHFIYVFSKEDKEKLQNLGFSLLKNDEQNSIFVFALQLNNEFSFELLDGVSNYSLSDTLTF